MTRIGSVYAQALYDLSQDEGLSDRIAEELRTLKGVIGGNAEYVRLLAAPNLDKAERCALLEESLGGRVHPYVLNLARIMTEKGLIRHFAECCDAYQALYREGHGILAVTAASAVPLTEEQRDKLCRRLEKMTGKRVELSNQVDPSCLGGVRLDYDGRRLDDTLRHRLDAVRDLLHNTML